MQKINTTEIKPTAYTFKTATKLYFSGKISILIQFNVVLTKSYLNDGNNNPIMLIIQMNTKVITAINLLPIYKNNCFAHPFPHSPTKNAWHQHAY